MRAVCREQQLEPQLAHHLLQMWDMGLVEPVTLSLVSDLFEQQLEAAGVDPNSHRSIDLAEASRSPPAPSNVDTASAEHIPMPSSTTKEGTKYV